MICPQCNTQYMSPSKFCARDGSALLDIRCGCGAVCTAYDNYCSICGARTRELVAGTIESCRPHTGDTIRQINEAVNAAWLGAEEEEERNGL